MVIAGRDERIRKRDVMSYMYICEHPVTGINLVNQVELSVGYNFAGIGQRDERINANIRPGHDQRDRWYTVHVDRNILYIYFIENNCLKKTLCTF